MAQVIISMSEYEEYMKLKQENRKYDIPRKNGRFNNDNTLMDSEEIPF